MRSLVITAALAVVLALAGAGSAMSPSKVKGTVGPELLQLSQLVHGFLSAVIFHPIAYRISVY